MLNKEKHSNLDTYAEEEEDDDDTLSFRDLPILGDGDEEANHNSMMKKIPSLSSPEDPFEFFNNLLFQDSTPTTPRVIIRKPKEAEQELFIKRSASSSLSSSSNSSRRNSNSYYTNNNTTSSSSTTYSSISNVEKVSITSLTSMSSKSRRIMFMFGPVKFNNEMELSSIKMRQSKRALQDKYVSQAAVAGELAIVCTEENKTKWGLKKSLSRYRSRAAADSPPASARSCGCFS